MSLSANDGLPLPNDNDFAERINEDLKKGVPLEAIEMDTKALLRNFEWTAVRCQYQAQIYKDLLDYIGRCKIARDIAIKAKLNEVMGNG